MYCHLHFEIRDDEECAYWGRVGIGYSSDKKGFTDPSDFIDDHRSENPPFKPDLTVREVYLTDNRTVFSPGEAFKIYTRVKNVGGEDVDHDIRIEYYLSEGKKIDDDPEYLGHDDIDEDELTAGHSGYEEKNANAPSKPGIYNITVEADTEDDVDEEHESNNTFDPPLVFEVSSDEPPPNVLEAIMSIITNVILDDTPPPCKKGDVNNDGEISPQDAVEAFNLSLSTSWTSDELCRADYNGDGEITSQDAVDIFWASF